MYMIVVCHRFVILTLPSGLWITCGNWAGGRNWTCYQLKQQDLRMIIPLPDSARKKLPPEVYAILKSSVLNSHEFFPGLQSMEEYLNEYMESIKSRRISREQKENLQAKLVTLKEIYTTYLNTLPPDVHYPKTADVFQELRVKEIMYDPASLVLSPEQIDRLHDIFPDILGSWADSIKQRVIESISKDASIVFDPTNVLQLASTAFQCDRCYEPFPASEVIRHRCSGGHYQYDFHGTEHYELFKHISDFPWCGRWKLSKVITEKVAKVLETCSFDPATTTIAHLEKADPIFECLACHDILRGRCMLRWFGVVCICYFNISLPTD